MIRKSEAFGEHGINFLDATAIFDDIKERVYVDRSCHYNDKGYELLIDAIIARLAESN